mgnify:FL=1
MSSRQSTGTEFGLRAVQFSRLTRRGILLGLFFLGVGMSLDINVVLASWQLIAGGVVSFMLVKSLGIYVIARLFKAKHREALHRAALFAQGGEFAFVLYAGALAGGVMDAQTAAGMTADRKSVV